MLGLICVGLLLVFIVVFILLLVFKIIKWAIVLIIIGVVIYFLFFRDVDITAEMIRSIVVSGIG